MKPTVKQLQADWKDHNAFLKRIGSKLMSYDDYLKYRSGKMRYKPKAKPLSVKYDVSNHRSLYPSASETTTGVVPKKENVYTGTYVIGIGVMHKSNLVPVTSGEDAKAIATMRRN